MNSIFVKKKVVMKFWGYTDNSKMWLIYPAYTFSYIIIILIYRKIYFHLSTIDKKKLITKYSTFPLFTRDWFCRFITSAVPSPTSHSLIIHNADHSWRSYLSSTREGRSRVWPMHVSSADWLRHFWCFFRFSTCI